MLSSPPAKLQTSVKAMRPSTSSMSAAARIVLPTLVSSFFISLSVSTVMLTDVAVRMVPMKIFSMKPVLSMSPASSAPQASAVPMRNGTTTPRTATIKPALPLCLSSLMSVPIPAENISTMTPSSLSCAVNSVSDRRPSPAGLRMRPAISAPTTCGIWSFCATRPRTLVLSRISARSSKK